MLNASDITSTGMKYFSNRRRMACGVLTDWNEKLKIQLYFLSVDATLFVTFYCIHNIVIYFIY